jgi:hypothetical protein
MDADGMLAPIALIGIILVIVHGIDVGDFWPSIPVSRFDLGWPKGVQEEEPVAWRTELARPRNEEPDAPR